MIVATAPSAFRSVTTAASKSPASAIPGSKFCPKAWTSTMSPRKKRAMSKSWIVMSRKMPPETFTYSTGGAAGSRLMMSRFSRSPTRPSATAARSAANDGSKRRLKPNMTGVVTAPSSSRAASTSAMSRAMGFSHRTALPAFAAASRWGMCRGVGDPMMTASIESSVKTESMSVVWRAPWTAASFSAASPKGSAMRARAAPGWEAMVRAWTWPMRPAPMTAMLSIVASPSFRGPGRPVGHPRGRGHGAGITTSRTRASRSASACRKPRSVLAVAPKVSNSSGVMPSGS